MANDLYIFATISFIFIIIGGLLPLFASPYTDFGTSVNSDFVDDVGQGDDNFKVPGVLDFFASIGLMFFWSFNISVWVNLIVFEPLRLILYAIIVRWVRGIG